MKIIFLVTFFLQAGLLFFDEMVFHRKRGLPLWEKIGHPLDSFSVLSCYLFLCFSDFNDFNLVVYSVLSVFSCFLITKDEFIHKELSSASENWLHSVLFMLHPVTLFSAGSLWAENLEKFYFAGAALSVLVFMLYQILYWSFYEKRLSR